MTTKKNMIRENNLNSLKKYFFKNKSALKAELSKETGISVVTINSLVKQLLEENILIEGELVQQPLGRPAINYYFNYEQNYFLLLSIQEKKLPDERKLILVGKIVNLAGDIKFSHEFDFIPVTLDSLMTKIAFFLKQDFPISSIGLSLPGKLYEGEVISSLEDLFNHWRITDALKQLTDTPIIIENDAHLLTVGHIISQHVNRDQTIVGIFYPENSMPGITIYNNGSILSGNHNLAGEAKFLPHLIKGGTPANEIELIHNLIEILAIYNVVITPAIFIISSDSVDYQKILKEFDEADLLSKKINEPQFLFIDNFQNALDFGLRWLVAKDSIYSL